MWKKLPSNVVQVKHATIVTFYPVVKLNGVFLTLLFLHSHKMHLFSQYKAQNFTIMSRWCQWKQVLQCWS